MKIGRFTWWRSYRRITPSQSLKLAFSEILNPQSRKSFRATTSLPVSDAENVPKFTEAKIAPRSTFEWKAPPASGKSQAIQSLGSLRVASSGSCQKLLKMRTVASPVRDSRNFATSAKQTTQHSSWIASNCCRPTVEEVYLSATSLPRPKDWLQNIIPSSIRLKNCA